MNRMRLFDVDKVGCYLDAIGHRVEKTKDGKEIKMVDLTLRVQPFTSELAVAFDPDVRALLFNMGDALPRQKLKAIHFALTVPKQGGLMFTESLVAEAAVDHLPRAGTRRPHRPGGL